MVALKCWRTEDVILFPFLIQNEMKNKHKMECEQQQGNLKDTLPICRDENPKYRSNHFVSDILSHKEWISHHSHINGEKDLHKNWNIKIKLFEAHGMNV